MIALMERYSGPRLTKAPSMTRTKHHYHGESHIILRARGTVIAILDSTLGQKHPRANRTGHPCVVHSDSAILDSCCGQPHTQEPLGKAIAGMGILIMISICGIASTLILKASARRIQQGRDQSG